MRRQLPLVGWPALIYQFLSPTFERVEHGGELTLVVISKLLMP
jgi:hypothetical protein